MEENILTLYRYKHTRNFKATCANNFFAEPIITRIDGRTIEFTHPTLDYRGAIHEPNKHPKGWSFGITGDLDEGLYVLDSENSDIDTLIFYKQ